MNTKEKLEFYIHQFEKEDARRQEVYSALNIPIAFFSALVSIIFFLISTFNYSTESFLKLIFLLFISLSIIILIIILYYLIKANTDIFKGYIYSNIPSSKALIKHNEDLITYYTTYFQDEMKGEMEFENNLIHIFKENADYNNYINEKRHSYIYKSKQWLVLAVISFMISLIPYGYNKLIVKSSITINDQNCKCECCKITQDTNDDDKKNINQYFFH